MKKRLLLFAMLALVALGYNYFKPKEEVAVFNEVKEVVLEINEEQKAIKPFKVNARKVSEYYDGKPHDLDSITKYENVYRGNQGIDYTYQKEQFEIIAILDGIVSEVKSDQVFGNSITITSNKLKITYESLSDIKVKKGDEIKQGMLLGLASDNAYHKDLGNHLHLVVTIDDKLIHPEKIYGKSLKEIVQ